MNVDRVFPIEIDCPKRSLLIIINSYTMILDNMIKIVTCYTFGCFEMWPVESSSIDTNFKISESTCRRVLVAQSVRVQIRLYGDIDA